MFTFETLTLTHHVFTSRRLDRISSFHSTTSGRSLRHGLDTTSTLDHSHHALWNIDLHHEHVPCYYELWV
jgi:hypothetical protein